MSVTPIVALDFNSLGAAISLVERLGSSARFYKVGSELFTAVGPKIVASLRARGCEVFLDLKFHDIPHTVAGAVHAATDLGVSMISVHATGGEAMLRAAADAAGERSRILAVTVLTSLDARGAATAWGRGAIDDMESEVVRLAKSAADAGIRGFVCSGREASSLRRALGANTTIVVPGIRFADGTVDDQARSVTPEMAAQAGADYVVVGRPVSAASDPAAAMTRLNANLELALKE